MTVRLWKGATTTVVVVALALASLACADDEGRPGDSAGLGETHTHSADTLGDTGGFEESDSPDDAESSASGPDLDAETDTDTGEETDIDPETGPPLYPGGRVLSPMTGPIVEAMLVIRNQAPAAPPALFAKVGASSTVSPAALNCFAGDNVDLDDYSDSLAPTLTLHLGEPIADATSFDRDTLAAQVGKTAGWAIAGAPSPLDQELAAIEPAGPSLAFVHYGANDMHQGITYASALRAYYGNMSDLLDQLVDLGVVPVIIGLSRRLDNESADLWVETYNAVARGLAQARRIPFIDLREALEGLPGKGLSGDGLHLEAFAGGACLLTPEGLGHGYNIRNLAALQTLERLGRALLDGQQPDPDPGADPSLTLLGLGSIDDPFEIGALPFADSRDSAAGPGIALDSYSGCASMADESGPEHLYRFELTETTRIRAMVLDRADVDVDIHLLDDSASEEGCLLRDDRMIEAELEPGLYFFALDTYVDGEGIEQTGEYTFIVLECEPGDTDCLL